MEQNEVPDVINEEVKRLVTRHAAERARVARWDLNVAVFLFAVLITGCLKTFSARG